MGQTIDQVHVNGFEGHGAGRIYDALNLFFTLYPVHRSLDFFVKVLDTDADAVEVEIPEPSHHHPVHFPGVQLYGVIVVVVAG